MTASTPPTAAAPGPGAAAPGYSATSGPSAGGGSAGMARTGGPANGVGVETGQGKTTIADPVVSKIARIAASEIPGVHNLGGGAARAFGAITERIPGARASSSQGVSVEVGERQAAVDLTVVVEYGVAITELARATRRNVIGAVEQMTGLEVVEVNINVVDLHLPSDDDNSSGGGGDQSDQSASRPTNRVQ